MGEDTSVKQSFTYKVIKVVKESEVSEGIISVSDSVQLFLENAYDAGISTLVVSKEIGAKISKGDVIAVEWENVLLPNAFVSTPKRILKIFNGKSGEEIWNYYRKPKEQQEKSSQYR